MSAVATHWLIFYMLLSSVHYHSKLNYKSPPLPVSHDHKLSPPCSRMLRGAVPRRAVQGLLFGETTKWGKCLCSLDWVMDQSRSPDTSEPWKMGSLFCYKTKWKTCSPVLKVCSCTLCCISSDAEKYRTWKRWEGIWRWQHVAQHVLNPYTLVCSFKILDIS